MSNPPRTATGVAPRIALVGATGLIGGEIIRLATGRDDFRLCAIARRETPLPKGVKMEMFIAEPAKWGEVLAAQQPDALICALGTTWSKSGQDEQAFRAVDQQLVLDAAKAAHECGVTKMVAISSVGADPHSKSFYLKVKGETEQQLMKLGFGRLDILRPGLLRGRRSNDRRSLERLGIIASPLTDLFLHGKFRQYRSVGAKQLAMAALAFALRKANGRFVHEHDAIRRAARELPLPEPKPELADRE